MCLNFHITECPVQLAEGVVKPTDDDAVMPNFVTKCVIYSAVRDT